MKEKRKEYVSLREWLGEDRQQVRQLLCQEAGRAESVLAQSIEDLKFPTDVGAHLKDGFRVVKAISIFLAAVRRLETGALLSQILIPSWVVRKIPTAREPFEEGTPLGELMLPSKISWALCESRSLARALGLTYLERPPYVEEVVSVLEDESLGEDFLLAVLRFVGPKGLEELKEKLEEKGFFLAEGGGTQHRMGGV